LIVLRRNDIGVIGTNRVGLRRVQVQVLYSKHFRTTSLVSSTENGPQISKCTMIRGAFASIRGRKFLENAVWGLMARRRIASSTSVWAKKMPDRPPPISEDEFTESFLKGSGPGGQKIVCQRHFNSNPLFPQVV